MKAVVYENFRELPELRKVSDPVPTAYGVVIEVKVCGICRSDWHGWMGNDPDIRLPHVPGHELAGVIAATGRNVKDFRAGQRVTVPFVCGCGACEQCAAGNQQICDHQFQPGFTHWGAFAEFVAIDYADTNLVQLPDEIDLVTAASLGCRFITSFRAVKEQGQVREGQWVAVWGCGGVGLSAIMIAGALGARVVAIDIADDKLELARSIGAELVVNSRTKPNMIEAIRDLTGGGPHVSMDALGHPQICFDSISSLRKQGRHIQIGIMEAGAHHATIPIELVIARELAILGSHGMQAHRYPEMFRLIREGKLHPEKLIGKTIPLEFAAAELANMNDFSGLGLTIIDRF